MSAPRLRPLAAGERRQLAEVAFTVGWTMGALQRLGEELAEDLDGYSLAERLADLAPDGGEDR